jgi:hypothetical protein
MSDLVRLRQVLVLVPWPELRVAYESGNVDAVERILKERLSEKGIDPIATEFSVIGLPSLGIRPSFGRDQPVTMPAYPRLVITLDLTGDRAESAIAALRAALLDTFGRRARFGADLLLTAAEHWCPSAGSYPLFEDRTAALELIGANALGGVNLPGTNTVNLVFVDTGLPEALLPHPGQFRGWTIDPDLPNTGLPPRVPGNPLTEHGAMVARNALAVALGGVVALDCPLVPDGISDFPQFIGTAVAALIAVLHTVREHEMAADCAGKRPEGWVLCNAWGVFDPSGELPAGSYTRDPAHPLATELARASSMGVDVVFAAGNCGQFCPNRRCSPEHIGPGRSIHGANAHRDVLTVGAVRCDRLWLGYSGQGPGPAALGYAKPDLCAPSQFAEPGDAFKHNGGTSAACGLAAGAVAALRTRWDADEVPPTALRGFLAETASQPDATGARWNERYGFGILNCLAAAQAIDAGF